LLPQLRGDLFLTDGGIETTLILHRGLDLPEFAAFPLLEDAEGLEVLLTRAAGDSGLPAAISFTVETDARLPSGQTLGDAIVQVDRETDPPPAYYMVNCAPHPLRGRARAGRAVASPDPRLRANASTKSHAELDEAADLDAGDPADLAARYAGLRDRLPALTVLGGCCGTGNRHIAEIAHAWRARE
jgi:S-methylmethionine-dependent homocysteine/selenocysteine methylase